MFQSGVYIYYTLCLSPEFESFNVIYSLSFDYNVWHTNWLVGFAKGLHKIESLGTQKMQMDQNNNIMKNAIFLIICFSLLQTSNVRSQEATTKVKGAESEVSVMTTSELNGLVSEWAKGFEKANPGMRVNLSPFNPEQNRADNSTTGLIMITDEGIKLAGAEGSWKMVVGRDIIVPVINAESPFSEAVSLNGVSVEKMKVPFSGKGESTLGALLGNDRQGEVRTYIIKDNSVKTYMSAFLGVNIENLTGTEVENAGELLTALQNDPSGIGFCRLSDITDPEGEALIGNVRLIPIDVNNNGQLDYFEQIYGDPGSFERGVYIGKYPKTLFSNIFAVSSTQPTEGAEIAFIRWMLSDGQQLLAQNGYTELAGGEAATKAAGLAEGQASVITLPEGPSVFSAFLMMLAGIIVAGAFFYALYRLIKFPAKNSPAFESVHDAAFSEKSLVIPKGLFFDKTHTWAFMERDGAVRVGVDDFIQHITGTVTRLKMKKPGDKILKGETILSLIQKGKQLNIYSPVSGTITSTNEALTRNSSIINSSPYSDGWVYKIDPENWVKESRVMIMAEKYTEWLMDEFARLRDFLATKLGANDLRFSQVVFQDGGEIREGLLEDFGPEIWEDFQTGFIDKSR